MAAPERSYETAESSGCMSLMGDDGGPGFLGCMLSCMERPPDDDAASPGQAAGDLLAQAEVEERRGNYGAASELYRKALRLDPSNAARPRGLGVAPRRYRRHFGDPIIRA